MSPAPSLACRTANAPAVSERIVCTAEAVTLILDTFAFLVFI
jgi:hypothetical protein